MHRNDRHGHYRDGRRYRDRHWRRGKQWRGNKHARRHWRQHKGARKHWRAHRRQNSRAARRHWHGDRVCYTNHGYQRNAFSLWLDDVGITVRDERYR